MFFFVDGLIFIYLQIVTVLMLCSPPIPKALKHDLPYIGWGFYKVKFNT